MSNVSEYREEQRDFLDLLAELVKQERERATREELRKYCAHDNMEVGA